jgi:D-alanyl-D-alanine carboxypeptidase
VALQTRLDGIRVKYGIPGVSVAILFADGAAWIGASGSADLGERIPVTPSTAFAVASITKTFTGALVLTLVEDGAVRLDEPVRRYLPGLDIDRRITVRQLLDHTSGLRDYFFHPRIDRALLSRPERRWDAARSLRYVGKPYFKPGRGWHYSNTNYLILGMLAEAVTGDPLAVALRERFFEPLALRNTYEQTAEEPRGAVAHGYRFQSGAPDAKAIDLSDGTSMMPFTSVVTAAAGAGAIASSATDLARWARALYGGEVLAEDSLRAMLDDATRTDRYKPPVRYGLGVQFVDLGGRPAIGHSGRLLGFRSVVRWLPAERMAVAVVTNQSRTDPGIIARALSKIALRVPVDCDCGQRR